MHVQKQLPYCTCNTYLSFKTWMYYTWHYKGFFFLLLFLFVCFYSKHSGFVMIISLTCQIFLSTDSRNTWPAYTYMFRTGTPSYSRPFPPVQTGNCGLSWTPSYVQMVGRPQFLKAEGPKLNKLTILLLRWPLWSSILSHWQVGTVVSHLY